MASRLAEMVKSCKKVPTGINLAEALNTANAYDAGRKKNWACADIVIDAIKSSSKPLNNIAAEIEAIAAYTPTNYIADHIYDYAEGIMELVEAEGGVAAAIEFINARAMWHINNKK